MTIWTEHGGSAEIVACSECGRSGVTLYKFDCYLDDDDNVLCQRCATLLEPEEE